MQITALGHSCVLLEFDSPDGPTRILVDPWLSDHAIGDGMGRFPRVRFEEHALEPVHGIYLTHGHSDHLDPYTLVALYDAFDDKPVLLLPATLAFLVPVFREHLPDVAIQILHAHVPARFRGIELLGFYDISPIPTNEDDVMVLVVTNGTERVLLEADANLSFEHPELRAFVSHLLREPGIDSAVFLTTENELTGTLESKDCRTLDDREDLVERAMDEMLQAVVALYEPNDDPDDLWFGEHVVRLIHGQGLGAPGHLDARWNRILFPVRIAHRVREERAVAERLGYAHTIAELAVGQVTTVMGGSVTGCTPLAGLTLLDDEASRTFDGTLAFFPEMPCAPLRGDAREPAEQERRLLDLLNGRFLPYLHGARTPPVHHLLAGFEGAYRIRLHFGSRVDERVVDAVLSFEEPTFVLAAVEGEAQEAYWANDLEDFLDGRCDEFSDFCRTPLPRAENRLWACLAMPLLNADLLRRRTRLHFERARAGETADSFVRDLYAD